MKRNIIMCLLGISLIVWSLCLLGIIRIDIRLVSFILLVLGFLILVVGLKNLIINHIVLDNDDMFFEKNMFYSIKAKGNAFHLMTIVFGILLFVFSLMEVDYEVFVLLLLGYIIIHGYAFYLQYKQKR